MSVGSREVFFFCCFSHHTLVSWRRVHRCTRAHSHQKENNNKNNAVVLGRVRCSCEVACGTLHKMLCQCSRRSGCLELGTLEAIPWKLLSAILTPDLFLYLSLSLSFFPLLLASALSLPCLLHQSFFSNSLRRGLYHQTPFKKATRLSTPVAGERVLAA